MAEVSSMEASALSTPTSKHKLTHRAFYESIGSPKYVVAPMVDRSEFAWRLLTRSYLDEERSSRLLAYTPMLHARQFGEHARFRDEHFQPTRQSLTSKVEQGDRWLDGNPKNDRPLFVQFCANKPDQLLEAAQYVAPYCDAVDLNLGCPQGIAKAGNYGAFLQEDWDSIYKMINKLHKELSIPVTAKMRILDSKERTLAYAKMILSAGASILTVHGRRREQKGHNTGLADWQMIRYLRDKLPPETVLFANGNILNSEDLESCLEATGADAIMSAEGNLSDPTIFAKPPLDPDSREYWRGADGKGGYRLDGVCRRYMDIIYKYVLEVEPPQRDPLYIATDPEPTQTPPPSEEDDAEPPPKKRKKDTAKKSPNLRFMQGHFFQLLRPMVSTHTDIRDALARTRVGDLEAFEKVLTMLEHATKNALKEDVKKQQQAQENAEVATAAVDGEPAITTDSERTAARYGRPWWVCQPKIRPLPEEAIQKGALTLSKKSKAKSEADTEEVASKVGAAVQTTDDKASADDPTGTTSARIDEVNDVPKAAMICG